MIRTIWLGFTFLILLAAVASFRFAYGNFDPADATGVSRPENNRIALTRTVQQPAASTEPSSVACVPPATGVSEFAKTKSDRDPVGPLLRVAPTIAAASNPSRPWHELPSFEDRQAKDPKIKRKNAEFAKPEPDQDAVEPLLGVPPAIVSTSSSTPPWRDLSSFAIQQKDQKIRRKNAKKEAASDKDLLAVEPRACQLEDFDAVRWAFNLPTGCFSSESLL